jgi:hypothetical protein
MGDIFSFKKCIIMTPVRAPIELYHAEKFFRGISPYFVAYEKRSMKRILGRKVKYWFQLW